jgi:hypothetical protein
MPRSPTPASAIGASSATISSPVDNGPRCNRRPHPATACEESCRRCGHVLVSLTDPNRNARPEANLRLTGILHHLIQPGSRTWTWQVFEFRTMRGRPSHLSTGCADRSRFDPNGWRGPSEPARMQQGSVWEWAMPVEMTIRFEWNTLPRVGLDRQGKLVFPRAPSRPGLYRFEIDGAKGRQEYIGETDMLDRRFQHYRTPDPSQSTNVRLNALMREVINSSGAVGVSIMVDGAAITMEGRTRSPPMQSKSDRVLLEHAAIYAAREAGISIVNI